MASENLESELKCEWSYNYWIYKNQTEFYENGKKLYSDNLVKIQL